MKCIGFDATEDHRVTYTTAGGLSVCPDPELPAYSDRYQMRYPLREWGFDRAACGKIIVDAGLPLPPKSSCFFCPAMRDIEIAQLAREEPDLYKLALEMERLYREGRHFRGDNFFTVKAVRPATGEKVEMGLFGEDAAAVRDQFRTVYNDTAKPFNYKVRVSPAVRGLSRSESWESKKIELPMLA